MPRLSGTPVDYFVAKVRINYAKGGGWTEKYNFPLQDITSLQSQLTQLCYGRNTLLAAGHSIPYCSASQQSALRDSYMPATLPTATILMGGIGTPNLPQESATEYCNDPENGVQVGFYTNSGFVTRKVFRGIRDSWSYDQLAQVWNPGVNVPKGANPGNYTLGALPLPTTAIQNFLQWLMNNTVLAQPALITQTPPLLNYMGAVTAGYDFMIVDPLDRSRKVGQGYNQRKARRKARI